MSAVVNVIPVADPGVFSYLLFPDQNPANLAYFQNQLGQISDTLNEAGRRFMETSREVYERINSSDLAMKARMALRHVKGFFHPNQVVPLEKLEDIMAAQAMMQRFIMAQPDLRAMYHEQRADGYSDTYVDLEPGKIGAAHYDYRRVTDGIIQFADDGSWSAITYSEELRAGDRDLSFGEQVDVLGTWDIVRMFVKAGKDDPSNPWGGELG